MLPPEKLEAVSRGLREAFGVTGHEDISRLTGGQTASLVFRLVVHGSPYLMKIITRAEDPSQDYASMRAAAEAGLAPRVWCTDPENRISITDFVTAEPLPLSEALVRLACCTPNSAERDEFFARYVELAAVYPTDKDMKVVYGRVHWERLLHNVRQPRYQEALRIISARHATAPA